jgi:phage major head subunit gpT-like protein
MTAEDYSSIAVYLNPEAATALKKHVLNQTGSMRALSPWVRDAILEKMKAEGMTIKPEWID